MATYKTPEDEIKELKLQIRRFTELLEYYRSTSQFEIDLSMPPVNYFISTMDNWTAAYITNGRPVLIASQLGNDAAAVDACWDHLRKRDPYVEGRHRAAIQGRA